MSAVEAARPAPALPRGALLWAGALAVLALATLGHLLVGRSGMTPAEALDALAGHPRRHAHEVILGMRLPRVGAGALAGAALGAAGVLLRYVTGNPLAEPGLLGVSSGASLAVVAVFATGAPVPVTLAAMLGALGALGLVAVAAWGRWTDRVHLVLCGVLVGAVLTSLATGLLTVTGMPIGSVLRWLVGSLNGGTGGDVGAALAPAALGAAATLALGRRLGATRLPDDVARTVGAHPTSTRALATAAAVALTAAAVLAAGAVAFLGLAAPEIARRVLRDTAPARLVPAAAVVGAALLVLADLVAVRTTVALPWTTSTVTGVPVGALVAPLSAPFLVLSLRSTRRAA